ncbi:malate synthase A [Georgenia phoenicis]|uniref:malate synthase A n=1 Tax=unclassified Georgenia TaxID=2626815 RepID=UPI0039B05CB8
MTTQTTAPYRYDPPLTPPSAPTPPTAGDEIAPPRRRRRRERPPFGLDGTVRTVVDIPSTPASQAILTPQALALLTELHKRFAGRRAELLELRQRRRQELADGRRLDFRPETRHIREDTSWHVAPPAPGLEDRRVEITGPTERKMTINALNSGAKVWLADLEDANTPHLENVIAGQANLREAIRRTITYTSPEGKDYRLHDGELPTIVMRPRGWHLTEKHLRFDGQPMSASLVDFGLYMVHNAHALLARGSGPYFYLPKLENHLEARLWDEVFTFTERQLGIEHGTIRATVLIETITAAFEMEEILYELRDHSAGLNAGRWDYIFSLIKTFRDRPDMVLPDRADVTMTVPFMRAYTELLVRTCHRRGAHAIGGMSAFIPSKDPQRTEEVLARVRADKQREADDGFDGSWVAHPGMVAAVREVFDATLGFTPHQIHRTREEVTVTAADLLAVPPPRVTREGLRTNVAVALRYLEAWLGGRGAVGISGLMEDAATAEISRSQVWQWVRHRTVLDDGAPVTRELVTALLEEERLRLVSEVDGDADRVDRVAQAAELFAETALAEDYPPFLTIPAYARRID